jgi:hypothetical protein
LLPFFLAFPILAGLMILQTAIISQTPLLHGTADLILLTLAAWTVRPRVRTHWVWAAVGVVLLSYFSALPPLIPLVGYGLTVGLAALLRRRVWEVPIMAMFITVFVGTLLIQVLSVVALRVQGTALPLLDVFNLITLPSLVLNLLLTIPVYSIMGDLANWLYPEEFVV